GSKSLGVYSLDEATIHFAGARSLLDNNPTCASDDQVADFLVPYLRLLNMCLRITTMIGIVERYLGRLGSLGDNPKIVIVRHQYAYALFYNSRFFEMAAVQQETSQMAQRLGDNTSKAYSLAGEIIVSFVHAPKSLDEFETLKRAAINAASDT